jgi:archaellin
MFKFRSSKMFVAVLMVLVLATTAFAFAASNTMPASTYAGEGATVTSGYTVSNVAYNLNATTPSNIDSVSFDLNAAAGTVKVSLSGTFYNCTNGVGFSWSCTSTGETVAGATELRVVATE